MGDTTTSGATTTVGPGPPSEWDLTTLANVKEFGKLIGVTDDVLIAKLITRVSEMVEHICCRHFIARSWSKWYKGDGRRTFLYLSEYPIIEIAQIGYTLFPSGEPTTTLVSGTDFVAVGTAGRVQFLTPLYRNQWYRVDWTGGYATLADFPHHLEQHVIEAVLRRYHARKVDRNMTQERIAVEGYMYTLANAKELAEQEWKDFVPHRRMFL